MRKTAFLGLCYHCCPLLLKSPTFYSSSIFTVPLDYQATEVALVLFFATLVLFKVNMLFCKNC